MAPALNKEEAAISLHGRSYRLPQVPTVVVCVDGFDPEYLQAGIDDGILPTMASFVQNGFHKTAKCAMPSLTNPNNLSIITGMPTAYHGVSGNYYLDTKTGEEHMIQDASLVTGTTLLAELSRAGVRIAAITAKDKLRKILCHDLDGTRAICFSSQHARDTTIAEHGIEKVEEWLGQPQPSQYSPELSLFVLDAGLKLLEEKRADFLYLTLSDFIQHKHAPREAESNTFLQQIDRRLAAFVELGAVVAVTGDHGMSDKSDSNGKPNVLFVEDILQGKWPRLGTRVICPIADPFVKHHGALGGYVRAHFLKQRPTSQEVAAIVEFLEALPEVRMTLTRTNAAKLFETPVDREGDLAIIAEAHAALGARSDEHDLEMLRGHRLRTHGGLSEQEIPLLRSAPVTCKTKQDGWRNFDAFDIALNYW